jgi:hypothetical protein
MFLAGWQSDSRGLGSPLSPFGFSSLESLSEHGRQCIPGHVAAVGEKSFIHLFIHLLIPQVFVEHFCVAGTLLPEFIAQTEMEPLLTPPQHLFLSSDALLYSHSSFPPVRTSNPSDLSIS